LNFCRSIQSGLVHSCEAYVNSDGSLTQEGERARGCISNGVIISAAGTLGLDMPTPFILRALEGASKLTGCDGIVNWQALNSATNPTEFLKALGVQ